MQALGGASLSQGWAGAIAGSIALWLLARPSFGPAARLVLALVAGLLAALWSALLAALGAPWPLALPLAAAAPGVAARLASTRPGFAPSLLREQGLVALVLLATVAVVLPQLQSGWESATALNVGRSSGGSGLGPGVTFVVLASLSTGMLYAAWKRR